MKVSREARRAGEGAFLLLPLAVFLSCAGLSPVTLERERPAGFGSVEEIAPSWLPLAPPAGVSGDAPLAYFAGRTRSPVLDFRAVRVDLRSPALEFAAPAPLPQFPPGKTLSVRVSSFVRDNGCAAGINTNPFSPVSAAEGEERQVSGVLVSDGRVVSPPDPRFDALVVRRDGSAAIVSQKDMNLDGLAFAWGGFSAVLADGALPERLSGGGGLPRHPRSAAGLSADGRYLYLLAVDGRRPGSAGATEAELGLMLLRLGARQGLNFDGGGSTALALRFPGGKVRTANTPIHGGIPGRERGVAGCLGVRWIVEKGK
ncbi:MAG: phosphodiester glycosidase family protein [Treponematales bacterium]